MFIINCKNYAGAMTARDVRTLVRQARRSSAAHGVVIAVAPPTTMLAVAAAEAGARPSSIAPSWARCIGDEGPPSGMLRRSRPRRPLVLAQHTDDADAGGTTGRTVAAAVRAAVADGSLVNHSERRIEPRRRRAVVERLRSEGLLSVVCAATAREAGAVARLGPDYVAIEPPELIGTGRSVSTEQPRLISRAAVAVALAEPPARPPPPAGSARSAAARSARSAAAGKPRLLCGAGIATPGDVRRALRLGSSGILVASGIVKAANRAAVIDSFAKALATTKRFIAY